MHIFTDEDENLLVENLIMSSKLHYGLTPKTTRQFADELTNANNKEFCKNGFNVK